MMKNTKKRLTVCLCLLIGLLIFIWGNSAMPGQTSGSLSGFVGRILRTLLPFLDLESELGAFLLRKVAHFSEFFALGMCLCWLFGMKAGKKWQVFCLPLLCGWVAACVDEFIQRFSPGRYSSLTDVGIDTAGVLAGIILLLIGHTVCRKRSEGRIL